MVGCIEGHHLQPFIQSQLQAGKKQITIPEGSYSVTPQNGCHLTFQNLTDIEIIARNVKLICTKTTCAVYIEKCINLKIVGLEIDYDPLPFTQGRITSVKKNKHCLEITKGYPDNFAKSKREGLHYEIFEPVERKLYEGDYYGCALGPNPAKPSPQTDIPTGPLQKIATKVEIIFQGELPQNVENYIGVFPYSNLAEGERWRPHAIYISESEEIKLWRVTVNASPCYGFFEEHCVNNEYVQCKADRLPLNKDEKGRGEPRIRSLNADAFHSKCATIGPKYRGCRAHYLGDDCVAIHGIFHMILGTNQNQLRVIANTINDMNIKIRDKVQIMSENGDYLFETEVVAKDDEGVFTERDKEFVISLKQKKKIQDDLVFSERVFHITLEDNRALTSGSLICSANKIGNGFVIEMCKFGFTRARGLRIKADGEIRHNEIKDCRHGGYKFGAEYAWLEGGFPKSVKTINNLIDGQLDTTSPEIYLGYERVQRYSPEMVIKPDKTQTFAPKTQPGPDQVVLHGSWLIGPESITSQGDDNFLELNFQASRVYLVMDGKSAIPLQVFLDGKPLQKVYDTRNMNADGQIVVNQHRKYDIVDLKGNFGRHRLKLIVPKGISAYTFTFGSL